MYNDYSKSLYNFAKEALYCLKVSIKARGGIIDTQDPDKDIIYGLVWRDEGELVDEYQVKALIVINDTLCAILDDKYTSYSDKELEEIYKKGKYTENVYSLDGSSDIYFLSTASNILDNIDEYL